MLFDLNKFSNIKRCRWTGKLFSKLHSLKLENEILYLWSELNTYIYIYIEYKGKSIDVARKIEGRALGT